MTDGLAARKPARKGRFTGDCLRVHDAVKEALEGVHPDAALPALGLVIGAYLADRTRSVSGAARLAKKLGTLIASDAWRFSSLKLVLRTRQKARDD